MTHVRRTIAGAVAGLVALTMLPAVASAEITAPASGDPAQIAAGWLARELDEAGGSFASIGGTSDVILALDAVGVAQQAAVTATAGLEEAIAGSDATERTAGAVAKALMALDAQGRDYTDVGGVDLEQELRDDVMPTGQVGVDNAFAQNFIQSLAVQALSRTDGGVPDIAVDHLRDGQCEDGGFQVTNATAPCESDVDTTAMAVHALAAVAGSEDPAVVAGVDWLEGQQDVTGFVGGSPNANTTGLAGSAFARFGRDTAAARAQGAVRTLQVVCFGPADAHGAIGYVPEVRDGAADGISDDEEGSFLLATVQGVLAFAGQGYDQVSNADASDVVPTSSCWTEGYCDTDGVTVVVDPGALAEDSAAGVRCVAHEDGMSGLDALYRAGHRLELAFYDFGTAVCKIDGGPDIDGCFGDDGYWSYWQAETGGEWASTFTGAGDTRPEPGDLEGWRFGDGEEAPRAATTDERAAIERTAGATRYGTAIAVSRGAFEDDGAETVVLARGDLFADALAGTPLAIAANGPLLLTTSDSLLDEVLAEIDRVVVDGATVHLLGGEVALGSDVEEALEDAGYEVVRIAGGDRYETSVAIASFLGDPELQLLTTGLDFPDAVAAGTVAGAQGGAVLLTAGPESSDAVDAYLEEHDGTRYAIGGPAAAAYPDADAVVGGTRDETAVAVARAFYDTPSTVGIARRDDFADALTGGTDMARRGGPILLVATDAVTEPTSAYLCSSSATVTALSLYGGPDAIATSVGATLRARTAGEGC